MCHSQSTHAHTSHQRSGIGQRMTVLGSVEIVIVVVGVVVVVVVVVAAVDGS